MYSRTLEFDDTIGDEEYFILRAKETENSNMNESKSWLLAAKTLYPQNFAILFQLYQCCKAAENIAEAAEFYVELFQLFKTELWPEMRLSIDGLLAVNPTPEQISNNVIISKIPNEMQINLLTHMSDRCEEPFEHCRLQQYIITKFPETLPSLGPGLVDALTTAVKHIQTPSHVNCFTEMLVGDIIPMLLNNTEAEWPEKFLVRLLHNVASFYIEYFMDEIITTSRVLSKTVDSKKLVEGNENDGPNKKFKSESYKKYKFTWKSFFELLRTLGTKLKWELCSIFIFPGNREDMWDSLSVFKKDTMKDTDDPKLMKQFVFCLTIFFAYCLYHYTSYTYALSTHKTPLVLVEAFTLGSAKTGQAINLKKKDRKKLSRPMLSSLPEFWEVKHDFMLTVKCWEMLQSLDSFQREFQILKVTVHLDAWLSLYMRDLDLYQGKLDESDVDYSIRVKNVIGTLKKFSAHYYLKNHNSMIEYAVKTTRGVDTIRDTGSMIGDLVKDCDRHLYFLPLEKSPVLQYVIKALLGQLVKSLASPTADKNRLHSQLLVLSQYNWPSEKNVASRVFVRIKRLGLFTFQQFSKYIVNVDLLEQFMYLTERRRKPVTLDIIASNIFKRIDNYHDTKGAVKRFIKNQLRRCNDPIHSIMVDYISAEENFFPKVA